ncbi:MAG: iron-sulfur cluster assembly scaffold protein [bacterium]
MSAFRAVVLEHFRHPRNRGSLVDPSGQAEGANPLCGDRIRVQIRNENDAIAEARFTADACALCIASASLLTEHVRGMRTSDAMAVDAAWLHESLGGEPPAGRRKCAVLPLDTLRRALADAAMAT